MFMMTATASIVATDWLGWLHAALSLVGAASAVAALTPTPRESGIGRLYCLIDLMALNVGFAKDRPRDRLFR